MRPPVPPPSVFRAVPGFVIGFTIAIFVVGFLRALLPSMEGLNDLPGFFFSTDYKRLFMGDFIDIQEMLMWGLFGGAFGFIWGAGGVIGTPLDVSQSHALVKTEQQIRTRIPSDPDAPADTSNPVRQLFGVMPQTVIVPLLLILVILIMALIATAPVPGKVEQLTSDQASVGQLNEKSDFDFLGLYEFQNVNKAFLFAGFSVIVVLLVLGAPASLALLFYVLNRQVKEAEVAPPNPDEGQKFFPIRVIGFFNQWVLDVIDQSGSIFRPR